MFEIEKMLERDKYFCEFFTNREQREYGILYYNTDNPLSYDSNHAHILNLERDIDAAIRDIIDFYRSKHLTPRVYCSFVDNELDILSEYLTAHGFKTESQKYTYYKYNPAFLPRAATDRTCRRIADISQEIVDLLYSDGNAGEWTVKVLERHIHDPRYHLLGRFHRHRLVAMASVKTQDGYSRVDDVITHTRFRGRHFGTELMKYLVAYHGAISGNYLYLYANNPIAIRMYQNVGFEEIPVTKPNWSAWLEG